MQAQKMMGYDIPGDEKVSVTVRDWNSMKLAMWRSTVAWSIAMRQAQEILEQCKHADGCPGEKDEAAPCLSLRPSTRPRGWLDFWFMCAFLCSVAMRLVPIFWVRRRLIAARDRAESRSQRARTVMIGTTCPDRELRMSALVILNAGRQCSPAHTHKPDAPYFAPSREYFSEVLASLAAAQAENEAWRSKFGVESAPEPPSNDLASLPARLT